jgi:hypothetical protein
MLFNVSTLKDEGIFTEINTAIRKTILCFLVYASYNQISVYKIRFTKSNKSHG